MGFHLCNYCQQEGIAPEMSTGDIDLGFSSGREYRVPDMLPHYVSRHEYQPPAHFVDDVLNAELVTGGRTQTRSISGPEKVGYLQGEFPHGAVPPAFLEKLQRVIELATELGYRVPTKGIDLAGEGYR